MSRVSLNSLPAGTITLANNVPAPGARAYVYTHDTTNAVSVYTAESGLTTLSQPLTADSNGQLPGWVDGGQTLDIVASYQGGGSSTQEANAVVATDAVGATDARSVTYYGAKGDGKESTGAMTSGSPDLTDATNPFTAADVGKSIQVAGAGASGVVLQTVISTFVNPGHVTLGTTASATVSGARTTWATNDYNAFQAAINANPNGEIEVPPQSGQFYWVYDGHSGLQTTYFTWPSSATSICFVGGGVEETVIRAGIEGLVTNSGYSSVMTIGSSQTIGMRDLTLEGPHVLGGGGPPPNPASWTTGRGGLASITYTGSDIGALVRCIRCHFRRLNAPVVSYASIEGYGCHFEGAGSSYASQGITCGSTGSDGYSSRKKVALDFCLLSDYGDPSGGSSYQTFSAGTDHELYINACYFAGGSGLGYMIQHTDTVVPLYQAGRQTVYTNCFFAPFQQAVVLTSYNCKTAFVGCTFDNLQANGIVMTGPVQVDDCSFHLHTAAGCAITTAAQPQSTGLDYELQVSNSRFRADANVAANFINLVHANSTSMFVIGGGAIFEGSTLSGNGRYIVNGITSDGTGATGHGSNGRVYVGECYFKDHPSTAVTSTATNVLSVAGAHFLMSAGISVYCTQPLAETELYRCEFANSSILPSYTTTATVMRSGDNYGPGWAGIARNVQNAAYTLQQYDQMIVCTTTGSFTWTLPAASAVQTGKVFMFKNLSAAACTVSRAGTDTIDGSATTVTVAATTGKAALRSNGSNGWDQII